MPIGVPLEPGDLPLHPERGESPFERLLDERGELADAEGLVRRAAGRVEHDGGQRPCASRAARTVFARSIAIVIGPTPPGTGVILDATAATSSYFTSPTIR